MPRRLKSALPIRGLAAPPPPLTRLPPIAFFLHEYSDAQSKGFALEPETRLQKALVVADRLSGGRGSMWVMQSGGPAGLAVGQSRLGQAPPF